MLHVDETELDLLDRQADALEKIAALLEQIEKDLRALSDAAEERTNRERTERKP